MKPQRPADPGELGDYFRLLAARPPHPASRIELHEALRSRREDLRVVAARAIARWEDDETTRVLKECLVELAANNHGGGAVHAIAVIVAGRLDESDVAWALDLYFAHAGSRRREFELRPLFWNLPHALAAAAVRKRVPQTRQERSAMQEIEWARSNRAEVVRTFACVRVEILHGKPRSHAPRKRPSPLPGGSR